MSSLWLTSDTHFFHENLIKWETGRPEFQSIEEMHEIIVSNWNKVVKKGDKVYHLGDVAIGGKEEELGKLLNRLNGQKRLIVGNHDDIRTYAKGSWFGKIQTERYFKEFGFILTHRPAHESGFKDKWDGRCINVHGHLHRKLAPTEHHYCVCVEQTNYTPVNFEELRDRLWQSY